MFTFKKKAVEKDVQYIIDIIANYTSKKDIKKFISPISDEYFLIDDENQIYLCIGNGEVTFSNHVFLYKKTFSLSFTEKLKKQIKNSIEEEMQLLKKSLFKNETQLLSKVLRIAEKEMNSSVITHNFKYSI
ncbi:MAG: hypothetical protein K8F54_03795 [Altibacter sp.]|uniref:hypothetical protein n=1 Tax=Altibacter sp. TaxID=2024823 RepID=UPI001E1A0DC9|nr:hypothetical protein [Altibacter sp.]MBZ0326702.1 hypothetical protein [Altibacter sp.]